jgi:hypothetical protein
MALPCTVVKQSAGGRPVEAVEASVIADMQATLQATCACRLGRVLRQRGGIEPRQSILDIPGFLPPAGTAIPCSENKKAGREENAVFPALKSSICASLRHHCGTRDWRKLRRGFVLPISLTVCAPRHCARFYFF